MATRIPSEFHEAIFQKSAAGEGTRKISAWLLSEHGVKFSHEAVAALLRKDAGARADAAKQMARAKLATAIPTDLDRLERLARQGLRLCKRVEHDPDAWPKVANATRAILAEKLNRSGVDAPDDANDLAAQAARVASRIAAALAEEGEDMGEPDDQGAGTP